MLKIKISYELQKKKKIISIQSDETRDVINKHHMYNLFIIDKNIEETFIGFFEVLKDKFASELSTILLTEIKNWISVINYRVKNMTESCDGRTKQKSSSGY